MPVRDGDGRRPRQPRVTPARIAVPLPAAPPGVVTEFRT